MLKIKKDIFNLIFKNLRKKSRNIIMWDTKTDFSKIGSRDWEQNERAVKGNKNLGPNYKGKLELCGVKQEL